MTALKIISIALKPAQIVSLVVGMGFVAYFTKEQNDELKVESDSPFDPYDYGAFGRQEFFLYSTGVGVVFAVLGLVCVIAGLLQKKHGALAMAAVQAICAFQLLISSALVAKILTTYQKEPGNLDSGRKIPSQCEVWDSTEFGEYEYTCGQLTGGVVCGFLASVIFAVDAAVSFVSHKQAE